MQLAACPRNGTGLQASARPARGDPVSFVANQGNLTITIQIQRNVTGKRKNPLKRTLGLRTASLIA